MRFLVFIPEDQSQTR